MIRIKTICLDEAALVAVSALDDIVLHMLKASALRLTPDFLDWVVDEATVMVEDKLGQMFAQPAFAATLRRGDHRIALSQWVRHWVCPHIARRFEGLAGRLPEFSVVSPAEVLPLSRASAAESSQPLIAARPVFRAPPLAA